MQRKAVYAGSFYDARENSLLSSFKQWFSRAEIPSIPNQVYGLICPHAGYIYSGFCASHSYKLLQSKEFDTAVIIHPSHRGNHFGYSVSPYDEYLTPLGSLLLNHDISVQIQKGGGEEIDPAYHQAEHSMEVQLPFLKYIRPDCKVVPIMLGRQDSRTVMALAENLSGLLTTGVVYIVSTDLSHYYPAETAKVMDGRIISALETKNRDKLTIDTKSGNSEACGIAGIQTLMALAEKLTDDRFIKLYYTTSAEASGDSSQVVGYLSATLIRG